MHFKGFRPNNNGTKEKQRIAKTYLQIIKKKTELGIRV